MNNKTRKQELEVTFVVRFETSVDIDPVGMFNNITQYEDFARLSYLPTPENADKDSYDIPEVINQETSKIIGLKFLRLNEKEKS